LALGFLVENLKMDTNEVDSVIKNIIDVSSNIKDLIGSNDLSDTSKIECKKSLDQGLDLLIKVENDLEDRIILNINPKVNLNPL
jgi:hypothetical protein